MTPSTHTLTPLTLTPTKASACTPGESGSFLLLPGPRTWSGSRPPGEIFPSRLDEAPVTGSNQAEIAPLHLIRGTHACACVCVCVCNEHECQVLVSLPAGSERPDFCPGRKKSCFHHTHVCVSGHRCAQPAGPCPFPLLLGSPKHANILSRSLSLSFGKTVTVMNPPGKHKSGKETH